AREMGVAEGLAKSDQLARVAKAPRALLGVIDLADSEKARRNEAIVVVSKADDSEIKEVFYP
ncbi:hypothetical protein IL306_012800, partial [Fusarium sp. DS 682]